MKSDDLMLCTLDMETFYSTTHSLSRLNPIEYVMHPETEIQSVSITFDDFPTETIFGEENIRNAFRKIDWSTKILNAHNNAGFDALIAVWRFGIRPKKFTCTLALSRPFYGLTIGGSLAKVSAALGLPPKLSLEDTGVKGKKLAEFTEDMYAKMRLYNPRDTENCREIFKELAPQLPKLEHQLIDMCTRMTVYPQLIVDRDLLASALETEIARKHKALLELARLCGTEATTEDEAVAAMRSTVMSQPKFSALLERLGATIPMKESPTAVDEQGYPLWIPALSKKDEGMTDLLEHDDPLVRAAATVRLEVKSTQLETRLATFIKVSDCLNGWLPMPVNYCGAAISWRMSGGMKMNVQNLPRVNEHQPKASDALRQSIMAPDGKLMLVVDSSNIELRVAHMLAGQLDTIEKLNNGEDLYCWFASGLYGNEVTKKDIGERFIGKVAMLSLQYGAGWRAFQNMCRVVGKSMGLADEICILSDDEAKRIVKVWRLRFPALAGKEGIWKRCDDAIENMFSGDNIIIDKCGLCYTAKEKIFTPGGHWLSYPGLHQNLNTSSKKFEWKYGERQNASRLYGPMLFENICQHLARHVVMEQSVILDKRYPLALTAHDEAVVVPDEDEIEEAKAFALQTFKTPPVWWPDLPVSAEADYGVRYSDAK